MFVVFVWICLCDGNLGKSMVRRRQVAESLKEMGRLVASMDTALMASAYDFLESRKSVSRLDLSKIGKRLLLLLTWPCDAVEDLLRLMLLMM